MDVLQNYQPVAQSAWTGRADSLAHERLFQVTRCIDLSQDTLMSADTDAIALIGFCSDEGVRRNLGRVGAAQGPNALRAAMANLPIHKPLHIVDLGNVFCENNDLEQAQADLASLVALALQNNYQPCVLGGGHEIAWAHFQGICQAQPDTNIGIINFDAHFDLRPLPESGLGTSGTPFTQIADYCQTHQQSFNYLCLGIQAAANTASLFEQAQQLNVQVIEADELTDVRTTQHLTKIDAFISNVDQVYLTVCMDVFNQAFAPGVSAPQALGLTPWQVMPLLQHVIKSGKVISFDIAELAPNYDQQNRTAALAAQIVYNYLQNT